MALKMPPGSENDSPTNRRPSSYRTIAGCASAIGVMGFLYWEYLYCCWERVAAMTGVTIAAYRE